MKENIHLTVALSLCIVACFSYLLRRQTEESIVITGQVIDFNGIPVEGAFIALDIAPYADVAYSTTSKRDGKFTLVDEIVPSLEKRRIYICPPLPQDAFAAIRPPYSNTPPQFYLRLSGKEIVVKGLNKLDVGKLAPQIKYNTVKAYLLTNENKPLIIQYDSWRNLWVRILDSENNVITETTISKRFMERAVDRNNPSIKLALPEGEWNVQVSFLRDKNIWLKSTDKIKVKANESNLAINLSCGFDNCIDR